MAASDCIILLSQIQSLLDTFVHNNFICRSLSMRLQKLKAKIIFSGNNRGETNVVKIFFVTYFPMQDNCMKSLSFFKQRMK